VERLTLTIARRRGLHSGDQFEVLGDRGSGVVDAARPLSARPRPFWDRLMESPGHLHGGHLAGGHVDGATRDGHLANRHVSDEHLWPAGLCDWRTPPLYFGLFQFQLRVVRRNGDLIATSDLMARLVNSSPRRCGGVTPTEFESKTRRLSFTIAPSQDL
jgi:hypothetical protein